MLLALTATALSVHALALAPRAEPLRLATGVSGTVRAGPPPRLSAQSLSETKASLCKKLLYNKKDKKIHINILEIDYLQKYQIQ